MKSMRLAALAVMASACLVVAVVHAQAPLKLPAMPTLQASKRVDLAEGERSRVERLRDEESATAQRLRQAASRSSQPIGLPGALQLGMVNGKAFAQVAFTPGAAYALQGSGFGAQAGQMRLTGQFPGGVLPVNVELWQDGLIVFRVEPGFGGASDHGGVALQIRAAHGTTTSAHGARFMAARDTLTVLRVPASRVRWGAPQSGLGMQETAAGLQVLRHLDMPAGGGSMLSTCFLPGADEFDFSSLPLGFRLVGYAWDYTQPPEGAQPGPQPGSSITTTVDGHFAASPLAGGSGLRIHWAVVKRAAAAVQACDSQYAIAFRLEGPRGLSPF